MSAAVDEAPAMDVAQYAGKQMPHEWPMHIFQQWRKTLILATLKNHMRLPVSGQRETQSHSAEI
jgi:hypothetical protein